MKGTINFRCSGYPGVFCEPQRNCLFFGSDLFEELNAKLRNFLQQNGKNLPNLDRALTETVQQRQMLDAVAIKKERFEENFYQQQQAHPDRHQYPPQHPPQQLTQVPVPMDLETQQPMPTLTNAEGKVIQHLSGDMCLVESPSQAWKCLLFLDHLMAPQRVTDLRIYFPLHSKVLLNARLINPEKAIQYIATLAWNPVFLPNPGNTSLMNREVNDEHFMKYYNVLGTVGKVLSAVSKINTAYSSRIGQIERILDDNFGLLKFDEGLVLFDTCDFWISPTTSAAQAQRRLDNVVRVGDSVMVHACLIQKDAKVPFLATAVWLRQNPTLLDPNLQPAAISLEKITPEKIGIYQAVLASPLISSSLNASKELIDTKHVVQWVRGIVKAVFFDRAWKSNGSYIAGIVQLDSNQGFAFFMSKNFAKLDAVPNIGMEEYVNIYPTKEMPESHLYGGINFICTNLYAPFMKNSCIIPPFPKLKTILEDSSKLLRSILEGYPQLREDPQGFIR